MRRSCALLFLAVFLFSVVGRGFAFRPVENPFRYIGGVAEFEDNAIDVGAGADDEFGPMKPFKAKVRPPVVSVPTAARLLAIADPVPTVTFLPPRKSDVPGRIALPPRLRPPILRG